MKDLTAKTTVKWEMSMGMESEKGYKSRDFSADGRLHSWLVISWWNIRQRHWNVFLKNNLPDLPKHVWSSLWRW